MSLDNTFRIFTHVSIVFLLTANRTYTVFLIYPGREYEVAAMFFTELPHVLELSASTMVQIRLEAAINEYEHSFY